jgi:hypothetical protein
MIEGLMENDRFPAAADDDLMRRFLLGQVTAEERDRVEERFMRDAVYFEALCALEHDLLVSHVRGELPASWRERFESQLKASAARRQRVEETRAFMHDLAAAAPGPAGRQSHWIRSRGWYLASAAAILAIAIGAWRFWAPITDPPATTVRTDGAARATVATLLLRPGLLRSDSPQVNVLRVPVGVEQIVLEAIFPEVTAPAPGAELHVVGGGPIPVPDPPHLQPTGEGLRLSWTVAAKLLPRGDYLLLVTATAEPAGRSVAASRFFSIVE